MDSNGLYHHHVLYYQICTCLIQQNSIKNSLKLNNCSNFIALTVENLTNHTVPKWIKNKLIASQIQPLNNLLDFQTYLL